VTGIFDPEWVKAIGSLGFGTVLLLLGFFYLWKIYPKLKDSELESRREVSLLTTQAIEQFAHGQQQQAQALEQHTKAIRDLVECSREDKRLTYDLLTEMNLSLATLQTTFNRKLDDVNQEIIRLSKNREE